MKRIKNIILMGLLLTPFVLSAQDSKDEEFSISAQIRARGEYRNGALTPREEGDKAATFVNNRTRLTMDYKRSNLEFKLAGQHVGVWGQQPQINKKSDFILNEAWAKLKFNEGFFAQIGRQVLSYDDERILGGLDWNVAGRYHDLLKLGYANDVNTLHLSLAFNQNDEKPLGGNYYAKGGQPYKNMQTLWYHYGNNQHPFGISLLVMNLGREIGEPEKPKDAYMQTFGTYLTYKKDIWDLSGAVYYQTGKNESDRSVSAYMANAFAKANLSNQWAIGVGSDYLSGSNSSEGKYKAFDPLYGTHHKFYGTMDYFYASSFIDELSPGLWDNQLGIYYKTSPKVDMSLNYHYFMTAEKLEIENTKLDKGLGSELDFQINWSIMPDVKLMAGYSVMFGTKTMDAVKGGNHKRWQDWGWVSINISPNLFTTKR